MLTAEIISQGDEVLTGQTVDTNAAWLSERLTELGFVVRRHTTVGDRAVDIREAVTGVAERADFCVCTGGLGPTEDDLTSQAVAEAMEEPLVFDAEAMAQIEHMFARFGKPMPETNRKQALFPKGACRLDNRWGTAPGFALEMGRAWIVFLPGVPREMTRMFDHVVVPILEQRFALRPGRLVTLRTVGIGESSLQQRIGSWPRQDVALSYRTMPPENQVKLRFPSAFPEKEMRDVAESLASQIGEGVFAIEGLDGRGGNLPSTTLALLRERGETVAVSEWGCGGGLCSLLHEGKGAEDIFLRGQVWGGQQCPPTLAEDSETFSEAAARALAEGILRESGASYGLGLTVSADPNSQDQKFIPGATHVALATSDGTSHRKAQWAGDRTLIRKLAAAAAVDFLRRRLLSD